MGSFFHQIVALATQVVEDESRLVKGDIDFLGLQAQSDGGGGEVAAMDTEAGTDTKVLNDCSVLAGRLPTTSGVPKLGIPDACERKLVDGLQGIKWIQQHQLSRCG